MTMERPERPPLPGVRAASYRPTGRGESDLPPAKPVPTEQLGRREVMDHQLWEVSEDLRRIRWPKIWLDRMATALVGLAIALGVTGANSIHPKSHAVFFGMHYGYFVFAGLALIVASVLYAADSGLHGHPITTVRGVLENMERWQWIPRQEENLKPRKPAGVSLRQRLLRWWHEKIWDLTPGTPRPVTSPTDPPGPVHDAAGTDIPNG